MSKNLKKIVLVTPSMKLGGTERVVSVLASDLSEMNIQVLVYALLGKGSFYKFNEKVDLVLSGIEPTNNPLWRISPLFKLYRVLIRIKPDVVVSFGEPFNPLIIMLCKLLGLPVFVADRSSPERKQSLRTRILSKLFYPLAKGVFVQTQLASEALLSKNYTQNALVLPNPLIDFENAENVVKEKIVVTLGRLIESKNITELIEIFNAANITNEWALHIIGDGPSKQDVVKFIKENNCSETVKLVGAVHDVQKAMSTASIFAFASLSEGFPNALSEAIAIPLPVIAYDCVAGPADLIREGGNGFLIPLNDKGRFIEKLALLMESESLRNDLVIGFKEHREKYSSGKISQEFLKAIQLHLFDKSG